MHIPGLHEDRGALAHSAARLNGPWPWLGLGLGLGLLELGLGLG